MGIFDRQKRQSEADKQREKLAKLMQKLVSVEREMAQVRGREGSLITAMLDAVDDEKQALATLRQIGDGRTKLADLLEQQEKLTAKTQAIQRAGFHLGPSKVFGKTAL